MDYFIRRAGELLQHVHLQDAYGHADRHRRIGHGTINWPSVFATLEPLREAPRLILEPRDKAAIRPSAERLAESGLALML